MLCFSDGMLADSAGLVVLLMMRLRTSLFAMAWAVCC